MGAASEAILAELCQRGFLSLWAYPNPHRDKGVEKRKEGKELCDLLVIFGRDVIIFSDKSCEYPSSENEELDWERWYRRAVQESVLQISGAERWVREHPTRVFADRRCTVRLTPGIPTPGEMRVHRVVVALGARERCQRYFGGGSGSLPISGGVSAHRIKERRLFQLGDEGERGKFVHVFDDVSLSFVLRELDTVADFTEYLSKKEALFEAHTVIATGEEDLLSHYLLTLVGEGHGFLPVDAKPESVLCVGEDAHPTLIGLPQYQRSKLANEQSYVWDRLIEHFTASWRAESGTGEVDGDRFEAALRLMAAPGRVVRRQLGGMISSALASTSPNGIRHKAVIDTRTGDTAYAVVCMSQPAWLPSEDYRVLRHARMGLFARALRVRHEAIKRVLVIGTHTIYDAETSEDLGVSDLTTWSPEMDAETRREMEAAGIKAEAQRFKEFEFPVSGSDSREAQRRRKQLTRRRR